MARKSVPSPKRKPRISGNTWQDQQRYKTWVSDKQGSRPQKEGYNRARRSIQRAEQMGQSPSRWDKKIVKEYIPETDKQRQQKLAKYGELAKDVALEGLLNVGGPLAALKIPATIWRLLRKTGKWAGAAGAGAALGGSAQVENKKGGRVKKSTGKKRRRAALRGGRSELRGG
tara:strand:+ start:1566 stop:2081 length:516 start_codon:yes stop_codon:yes gene_type:complete